MSIIIDTNAVSITFDSTNKRHPEFKPVVKHLLDKRSRVKLVYGGTKYLSEVNNFKRFITLFGELDKIRKLQRISCALVDAKCEEIEKILKKKGWDSKDDRYNDGHILALVIASKTKLVITSDKKSIDFLRERCFYEHPSHIPGFYTSDRNQDMLSNPDYV